MRLCVCLCVCLCACQQDISKNYLTNQLFGGGLSSDPEMKWLDIEKNRPGGGGGGGGVGVGVGGGGGGRKFGPFKKIFSE